MAAMAPASGAAGSAAARGRGAADGLALTGAGELARLALRRDRFILAAWCYALIATVISTAYSIKELYPTAAEQAALRASVVADSAITAIQGPLYSSSIGGLVAWKILAYGAAAAGLMTIVVVIRHTRADEEAGRLELVGATVVGRQAALAASLAVAFGACLLLGMLVAAAQMVMGLPAAGAAAAGLAIAVTGAVFAGVAACTAQLSAGARTARGIALGTLGVAFLLRAVGDASAALSWLSWISPIGWAEQVRPYAADRWWIVALAAAVAAGLSVGSVALALRRDMGAGLLAERPGRPQARAWLRGPLALAWRLQRGTLVAWAVAFVVSGAVLGAVAKGIGGLLGSSPQVRAAIARMGGQAGLFDAYLAVVFGLLGVVAACYGVASVLRMRGEETGDLAEPVLTAGVSRIRWAAGHLVIAVAGMAVLLALAGLAAGLVQGLEPAQLSTWLPRLLGAALAELPAAAVAAAVAAALFGLAPRQAVPAAWSVLGVAALITLAGPDLRLTHWVMDVSPFSQVPKLPGGVVAAAPLAWLTAAAVVLTVAGLAGLRRRDIG